MSNDAIFCSNCHNELPKDSEFCQYCGRKLEVVPATSDNSTLEAAQKSQSYHVVGEGDGFVPQHSIDTTGTDGYKQQYSGYMSDDLQKKKDKPIKNVKTAVLIAGILAILVVVCVVLLTLELKYQRAHALLDAGEFDEARLMFKDMDGYRKSQQMVDECTYQEACALLDDGSYRLAIAQFKVVDGYKDSKSKMNEAKYQFVLQYKNNINIITYEYLQELKAKNYKDSAKIYKSLYDWKITVVAVNSSADDSTTKQSSISKYDPVYFHIKLSGGEPDESLRFKKKITYPDGEISESTSQEEWSDGDALRIFWVNGIYNYPENEETGTLRLDFYDDEGNIIGSGSVRITD